jgi:hypothetical protein
LGHSKTIFYSRGDFARKGDSSNQEKQKAVEITLHFVLGMAILFPIMAPFQALSGIVITTDNFNNRQSFVNPV